MVHLIIVFQLLLLLLITVLRYKVKSVMSCESDLCILSVEPFVPGPGVGEGVGAKC